jgi:hypothetical protein
MFVEDMHGDEERITEVAYLEINLESISFWVLEPDVGCDSSSHQAEGRVELPFQDIQKIQFSESSRTLIIQFDENTALMSKFRDVWGEEESDGQVLNIIIRGRSEFSDAMAAIKQRSSSPSSRAHSATHSASAPEAPFVTPPPKGTPPKGKRKLPSSSDSEDHDEAFDENEAFHENEAFDENDAIESYLDDELASGPSKKRAKHHPLKEGQLSFTKIPTLRQASSLKPSTKAKAKAKANDNTRALLSSPMKPLSQEEEFNEEFNEEFKGEFGTSSETSPSPHSALSNRLPFTNFTNFTNFTDNTQEFNTQEFNTQESQEDMDHGNTPRSQGTQHSQEEEEEGEGEDAEEEEDEEDEADFNDSPPNITLATMGIFRNTFGTATPKVIETLGFRATAPLQAEVQAANLQSAAEDFESCLSTVSASLESLARASRRYYDSARSVGAGATISPGLHGAFTLVSSGRDKLIKATQTWDEHKQLEESLLVRKLLKRESQRE